MVDQISSQVRAFAEGNFTQLANDLTNAGVTAHIPAHGILQLISPDVQPRPRLLLSVGVHGDETAPIEMAAHLLNSLVHAQQQALAVDLMVVVGNSAAIAQGKRFVDADMNRLFCLERGELQSSSEAQRAETIMHATAAFFAGADGEKWHLDLHTAIRPSHYPSFAVVPEIVVDIRRRALLAWLGQAGIGAAILNSIPADTFSSYTARSFGAASSTVELGRIGTLGSNDLRQFADAYKALDGFIRTATVAADGHMPHMFKVVQELIKHSDAFRMSFDRSTKNFTPMQAGTVIAEDGSMVYRVGEETEYVVFPNPDVRNGLRAGLMVVRAG